jgi:hypothetical protein
MPRRWRRGRQARLPIGLALAMLVAAASGAPGQELIDRVLVRVGTTAITLTDVQAAIGLGLVEPRPGQDAEKSATDQLVERQLLLDEVARFPPPEPEAAAVDREVARMKAKAGPRLAALMQSTGLDETRLRDFARDTTRIQAYLNERFGTGGGGVTDEEVQQYYQTHAAEFTRNGQLLPFDAVESDARQRTSMARRDATIAQWMRDLRGRADVIEVGPHTAR